MLIALLALLVPAASAACTAPTHVSDLTAEAGSASRAFVEMDLGGFKDHADHAQNDIPCLGDIVSPSDAAELHRMVALRAFVDRQDDQAIAAFRSALATEPDTALPGNFPTGHPLQVLYDRAKNAPAGQSTAISGPPGFDVWIDGTRTVVRPSDRPVIVQLAWPDGRVVWSGYDAPLPDASTLPAPPVSATTPHTTPVTKERHGSHAPLLAATGAVALASIGMYAGSAAVHGKYLDHATPYGDLDGLRSTNHALVFGAAGAGVATLGLGVALAVTW
jgi:hypothetical protein